MKPVRNGPRMLVLGLFVLFLGGLAVGPQAQASDFAYRKQITIDHTKVGTSATTLTNYPFLYSVTDLNLRSTAQCSPSPCGRVTDTGSSSGSVAVDGVVDSSQSGIGRNAATSGSGTGTQINVLHTVPAGTTNRLMLVGISATASAPPSISSVQWDATGGSPQSLTQVGTATDSTNATIWIYKLVAPTTGTNLTLRVTFGSTGATNRVVGVMSFSGV